MKRYRMYAGTSYRAEKYADRIIPKLGTILRIKAYRVTSDRDGLLAWRWQLLVVGTLGSARFNGCCWGYGGEGPRVVHKILKMSGVDAATADQLAFNGPRPDRDGTHWEWPKQYEAA